jgi:hypothetical protein
LNKKEMRCDVACPCLPQHFWRYVQADTLGDTGAEERNRLAMATTKLRGDSERCVTDGAMKACIQIGHVFDRMRVFEIGLIGRGDAIVVS